MNWQPETTREVAHHRTVDGISMLRARYITHSYAPHMHDGYAIGVIEGGAEAFDYRGSKHVTTAGQLVVICPMELHDGYAADEHGWAYNMTYPGIVLMRQIATELSGRLWMMPYFAETVFEDPLVVARFRTMVRMLEDADDDLERETAWRYGFGELIARYAANRPIPMTLGDERAVVRRVREHIEVNLAENTSLEALATLAAMSPYHLLRVFKKEVGVPPHVYRNHRRIEAARDLLRVGIPPADVALHLGYTDQSHLTRRFKRAVGVTPGQFAGQ